MDIRNFYPAVAISAIALLCACGTSGGAYPKADANDTPLASTVDSSSTASPAYEIGIARVGATVRLPAGNPTGALSADVLGEYSAASGRLCRQVLPHGGNGEIRLACQQRNGNWEWVRSLSRSSVPRPLPAIATQGAVAPLVAVGLDDLDIGIDVIDGDKLGNYSFQTQPLPTTRQ